MPSPRRRYPLSSDVPFYEHPDEENAEDPSYGFGANHKDSDVDALEILVKSLVIASFLSALVISAIITLYPQEESESNLLRR